MGRRARWADLGSVEEEEEEEEEDRSGGDSRTAGGMNYLNQYDAHNGFLLSDEGKDLGREGIALVEVGRRLIAGGLGSGECGAG